MFDEDFEAFWQAYPSKVGKLAAKKVYEKVRRGGIGQDELLDGITQYVATKPAYADYCHPRTWLSQGRWMDEVTVERPQLGKMNTRLAAALLNISASEKKDA